jgi:hypothetical protein
MVPLPDADSVALVEPEVVNESVDEAVPDLVGAYTTW